MIPHLPFIATPEHVCGKHRDGVDGKLGITNSPRHMFEALEHKKVRRDTFWEAYKKNLEYGLDYALELAHDLGGKTVFTADHGNMVGERTWPIPIRLYGHPRGVRTPEIVEVPWAELTVGERRECVDEAANSRSELGSEEIDDRLESLGYKL